MIIDLLLSGDGIGALIEQYDKQLLLAVNGSDSLYLDRVVRVGAFLHQLAVARYPHQ